MSRPQRPGHGALVDGDTPEFVQRGKVLVVQRQFQEAVRICRIGLLAEPTCVEGRLVLGMALMALGRFEEVLSEMRAALELDEGNAMTHLLRGEALLRRGQDQAAFAALSKARALDPRNEKILRLLAEAEARVSAIQEGSAPPTDTKLYPASSRKLESGETDVGEGDAPRAAVHAEEEEDERFTTAPWLPPKRPRTAVEETDGEDTAVDDGRRGVPSALVPLTSEHWTDASFSPLSDGLGEDDPTVGEELGGVSTGAQSLDFLPTPGQGVPDVGFDAEPTMADDMAPDASDLIVRQPDEPTAEMVSAVELWPNEASGRSAQGLDLSGGDSGESGIFDRPLGSGRADNTAELSDAFIGPDEGTERSFADDGVSPPHASLPDDLGEPSLVSSPFDQLPDAPRMEREEGHSDLTYDLPLSALEILPDGELSEERELDAAGSLRGDAAPYEGQREQADWQDQSLGDVTFDVPVEGEHWPAAGTDDAPLYLDDGAPEALDVARSAEPMGGYDEPASEHWPDAAPPLHLDDGDLGPRRDFDIPASPSPQLDSEPGPPPEAFESGPAPLHLDVTGDVPLHLDDSGAPGGSPSVLAGDAPLYLDEGGRDREPPPAGGELGAPGETHLPDDAPSEWGWNSEDSSFPPPIAVPSAFDSAEVGLESYDARPRRTAAMEDDGHFSPYVDDRPSTKETMAGGPRGYDSDVRPAKRRSSQPFDDAGIEDSFISEARQRRRHQPLPPERTTWVTLVLGESGRQRWIRGGIAVCIVLLALGGGFLFRSLRIGHHVKRKLAEARELLDKGNMHHFQQAAQRLADVVRGRTHDGAVRAWRARVNAAIIFEFGDENPAAPRGTAKAEQGSGVEGAALGIYRELVAGKLKAAERRAFDAREQFKESALVHYLSGRIDLLLGRTEGAARALEQAVKLSPRDCQAMAWLGIAKLKLDKEEDASKWLEKALRDQNPTHVTSHLGRAMVLLSKRRLAEADALLAEISSGKYQKHASRGQRGWAFALRAKVKALENRLKPARSFVDKAKVSAPTGDPAFYDLLADVLIDLFQLGEAEEMTKRSEKVMGERPHPRIAKARIYLLQGRAAAALRASDALSSEASAPLKARIQLELGKVAEARRSIEVVLERTKTVEAELTMARVLAAEGKLQEAQSGLTALSRAHPKDGRVLTALGKLSLEQRRYDEAKDFFSRAAKYDHTALGAKLGLADVHLARGDFERAHQILNEEHRTHPWFVPISKKLAWLDMGSMNLSDAKANLERVLRAVPGDMEAQLMLVEVLTLQRDFSNASRALEKAKAGGGNAVALAAGRLALAQEDAKTAISKLEEACQDGKSPAALVLLARAHGFESKGRAAPLSRFRGAYGKLSQWQEAEGILALAQGRPRVAAAKFKRAAALIGEGLPAPRAVAELHVRWAQALQEDGRTEEALRRLEEAKKRCRSCYFVYYREGLVLDELERPAAAIAALSKAAKLSDRFRDTYYWLGKIYADRGNTRPAIDAYNKYLALKPPAAEAKEVREALRDLQR